MGPDQGPFGANGFPFEDPSSEDDHFEHDERRAVALATFTKEADKLIELYHAGTPIFTKSSILELATQLEELNSAGGTLPITATAVDGKKHSLGMISRDQKHGSRKGFFFASSGPHIDYHTIDGLTALRDQVRYRRGGSAMDLEERVNRMYRSLTVAHRSVNCDRDTGRILPPRLGPPVDEILGAFEKKKADWEASERNKELKTILASAKIPRVKNIVALACHSLRPDTVHFESSATQHAIVLTLRDFFNSIPGADPVKCIAQDPAYLDVDKQILAAENITVVDDPHGFLQIDDESVVFSVSPNVPVKEIVADIARPALIIWDYNPQREQPEWREQRINCTDPILPHTINMLRDHYTQTRFVWAAGKIPVNICVRKSG